MLRTNVQHAALLYAGFFSPFHFNKLIEDLESTESFVVCSFMLLGSLMEKRSHSVLIG